MIFYWISVPFIYCAGFMSHIALMKLKRLRMEHHLMTLPEPDEKLAETIRCNIKNNRQINAQQKRKEFRIVKG